jgi:hypothetical protein
MEAQARSVTKRCATAAVPINYFAYNSIVNSALRSSPTIVAGILAMTFLRLPATRH